MNILNERLYKQVEDTLKENPEGFSVPLSFIMDFLCTDKFPGRTRKFLRARGIRVVVSGNREAKEDSDPRRRIRDSQTVTFKRIE